MDYSNFLMMKEELSLIAVMVILLLYDLMASKNGLRYFQPVACILFGVHALLNIVPGVAGEAFGGMYQYTPMMGVVKSILNVGTLIVLMQAEGWLKSDTTVHKRGEFYFLTLTTLLGMYFMISAGNFLFFFIGLETASIPMATLVAFDKFKRESAEAGAKYILNAVFASGLSLYGMSLIYGTTGTLYFDDIPAAVNGSPLQIMAFLFFVVGLFFKISLVPFHQWTPDVYQGAPTTVTSYLSVISKGAAVFVLMTILMKVFSPIAAQWQGVLYGVIIATITIANLFAIRQRNIKRFLAYSSISQAGYIVLGVISASALGMTSLVYYILVYMVSNLAAFGVISAIENRSGKVTIDDYNGLYATNPKLVLVMTLAMFSLAGIPPFAGFFSKFFIFAAAAQQGYYILVLIALINTIISLYYYLLVVKAMFINKNEAPIAAFRSDGYMRASLAACSMGILLLGVLSVVYDRISLLSYGM
ncbi:MAG: NADH-quinone oxidoreductase subunit N [Rikenellaceae bacterium]|nr:NADH-quinone oxidoreductase subunit N [Rikenellaceae bacterium]